MDPRPLPRGAQRRIQRAVLFGERLENREERQAAAVLARRWRTRPLRAAPPMLTAVAAGLALLWIGLALLRPAWAEAALVGSGILGGIVGAVAGCGIMVVLQRAMAKRAEALNSERDAANRRRSG